MGEGANLARSLSNRSSNDVTPAVLAEEARGLAEQHGLWIDVIEPARAAELDVNLAAPPPEPAPTVREPRS